MFYKFKIKIIRKGIIAKNKILTNLLCFSVYTKNSLCPIFFKKNLLIQKVFSILFKKIRKKKYINCKLSTPLNFSGLATGTWTSGKEGILIYLLIGGAVLAHPFTLSFPFGRLWA